MATTCKLIAKNVLGSSAASVSLSSIPATFDDLLLVMSVRDNRSGVNATALKVRFNGASTDTNHSDRYLYAGDASPASGTDSFIRAGYSNAAATTSNTFASSEVYIPNYANTSANKSVSMTTALENNSSTSGAWYIMVAAGLWSSTNAIDALEILPTVSANFVTGSSFFLYGIKKA